MVAESNNSSSNTAGLGPMPKCRTAFAAAWVCAAALAFAACGGNGPSPASGPSANSATSETSRADALLPLEDYAFVEGLDKLSYGTLSEWVTYASQVSVVTVLREIAEPIVSSDQLRQNRKVVLRVDRVLWSNSGDSQPPKTFDVNTDAWWLEEDGGRIALAPSNGPRFEVGGQYVVPLVRWIRRTSPEGRWNRIGSAAVLKVGADGTLLADWDGGKRLHKSGQMVDPKPSNTPDLLLTADQLAAELARTKPSPFYEDYKHLPPVQRYDAILTAEYNARQATEAAEQAARGSSGPRPYVEWDPFRDLSGWVTFASQVVVATVVEHPVEPTAGGLSAAQRAEIAEGRSVRLHGDAVAVLRVDETLWSDGATPLVSGTFEIDSYGWRTSDGRRFWRGGGGAPPFVVGGRYVLPLVPLDELAIEDPVVAWETEVLTAKLLVDSGGHLAAGSYGLARIDRNGVRVQMVDERGAIAPTPADPALGDLVLTTGQLKAALAAAEPSPFYEAHKHLGPTDRFFAIRAAEKAAPAPAPTPAGIRGARGFYSYRPAPTATAPPNASHVECLSPQPIRPKSCPTPNTPTPAQ